MPYRKNAKEDPVDISLLFNLREVGDALAEYAKKHHNVEVPESFSQLEVSWRPDRYPKILLKVHWWEPEKKT